VDVDTLNEQLKIKGALRLRHSHRPDEAFGELAHAAWARPPARPRPGAC
jgi:hypothetical protein